MGHLGWLLSYCAFSMVLDTQQIKNMQGIQARIWGIPWIYEEFMGIFA
jgi:hypothetical protein